MKEDKIKKSSEIATQKSPKQTAHAAQLRVDAELKQTKK